MISQFIEFISGLILLTIDKIGYLGIFFLMTLQSLNIPIPSEVVMPFSGFLVNQNSFNFWIVVFAGAFGSLIGSLISYNLASVVIKNNLPEKYSIIGFFIRKRSLEIAENWFKKYGAISIFFGRMIPVLSTFISFPAGLTKMNVYKFSTFTFLGSFIWCGILTYLGFVTGENWESLKIYFRKFDYLVFVVIIIGIGFWFWQHTRSNDSGDKAE